eukprot:scaffold197352_cov28-Tisochrysis_lutea.AAC.3
MLVVATLLANVEMAAARRMSTKRTAVGGRTPSAESCSPMRVERPDTRQASASAKPPPKSNRTPHGTRAWTCGQVTSAPPLIESDSTVSAPRCATAPPCPGDDASLMLLGGASPSTSPTGGCSAEDATRTASARRS